MVYLLGLAYIENSQIRFPIRHEMELIQQIDELESTKALSVSRHLLAYPADKGPVAKKNCSCLEIESDNSDGIKSICRQYLEKEAVGENSMSLFLTPFNNQSKDLNKWAKKARKKKPSKKELDSILSQIEILLNLNRGDEDIYSAPVISAGLRAGGNDGYFVWLPGMNKMKSGIYTIREILSLLPLDKITDMENKKTGEMDPVFVSERIYPVLKSGKKVLFVEPVEDYDLYRWETATFNSVRSMF